MSWLSGHVALVVVTWSRDHVVAWAHGHGGGFLVIRLRGHMVIVAVMWSQWWLPGHVAMWWLFGHMVMAAVTWSRGSMVTAAGGAGLSASQPHPPQGLPYCLEIRPFCCLSVPGPVQPRRSEARGGTGSARPRLDAAPRCPHTWAIRNGGTEASLTSPWILLCVF